MQDHPMYLRVPTEDNNPYLKNKSAAEAVISAIINAQNQGWLRVHGFVVLPDALELVISPIRQGAAGVIAHLQAEMMPVLSVLLPEAMFIWSTTPTYMSVDTQKALNARLQMLELSPVAQGLCDAPEEYTYSSTNPRYKANVAVYAGFAKMLPPDQESLTSSSQILNPADYEEDDENETPAEAGANS